MNDFELSYMHYARSRELMAAAERERLAKEARKGTEGEHREGLASRLAKVLHRKGGSSGGHARRFQLAK